MLMYVNQNFYNFKTQIHICISCHILFTSIAKLIITKYCKLYIHILFEENKLYFAFFDFLFCNIIFGGNLVKIRKNLNTASVAKKKNCKNWWKRHDSIVQGSIAASSADIFERYLMQSWQNHEVYLQSRQLKTCKNTHFFNVVFSKACM